MEYFKINVFKNGFGPIIELLNEHEVKYQMREVRSGVVMNSAGVIEVLQSAAMWGALATIIVAFIKARNGRKVMITTNNNIIIHAEGLTAKELENILKHSKDMVAIDVRSKESDNN